MNKVAINPAFINGAQMGQKQFGPRASIGLAQCGIESAWGRYMPPNSNNLFGIQSISGFPSVAALSHEYQRGVMVPVIEHFAKFPDVQTAFVQHARLFTVVAAYSDAMKVVSDPNAFAHALLGVYATAPNYDMALINLMVEDNLYQYDQFPGDAELVQFPTPVASEPLIITSPAILQTCLNKLGATLIVDNIFGVRTRAAVMQFQQAHKLDVDGDPGPLTDAAIIEALPKAA